MGEPNLRPMHISYEEVRFRMRSTMTEILRKHLAHSEVRKSASSWRAVKGIGGRNRG